MLVLGISRTDRFPLLSPSVVLVIFLKGGKPHGYGGAFTEFAHHAHLPAVQVGATLHEQQTQSRARTGPYVTAAMKRLEKLPLIFLRNTNPLVTNHAHSIRSIALSNEMDCRSWL